MQSARDFAFSTLLIAAMVWAALPAQAEPREMPPPGMAKYVVALWTPGLPLPGGGHVKKITEPDIEKLGGRVLETNDNRKTIFLPKAAARELRKHSAVIYLQRIWMGESLDDWDERFEPNNAGSGISSHSDENIDWIRSYGYDKSGNITDVDVNGVDANDHYTYDTAGRLIRAAVGGKVETYQYDDFGNLIEKAIAGSNPVTVPIDPATNRITGSEYDLTGNVTRHGFHDYEYDAMNMLVRIRVSAPIVADRRMIYDADDEKIGMIQGTGGQGALSRWTIRDFHGRASPGVPRGERRGRGLDLAVRLPVRGRQSGRRESLEWKDPAEDFQVYGGERHYHLDHLGSVRVVTNGDGRSLSEHDYFPFGRTMTRTQQEAVDPYDSHIDPMRFAGHARDFLGVVNAENPEYLDYMHARYYDPRLGRFLSVDPGKDWDIHQPQSWNMYAYVRNNPINKTDPTGRCMAPCIDVEFVYGAVSAFGSNLVLGYGRPEATSSSMAAGQTVGDVLSIVAGGQEIVSGAAVASAGGFVTVTTGGATAPVTVPAAAVGTAAVVHGTTVVATASANLGRTAGAEMSRTTPQIGRDRPRPNEQYQTRPASNRDRARLMIPSNPSSPRW